MSYNEEHRHHRDALLKFEPETHTYTCNGQVFKSVTTLVNEYFEQFDADLCTRSLTRVSILSKEENYVEKEYFQYAA